MPERLRRRVEFRRVPSTPPGLTTLPAVAGPPTPARRCCASIRATTTGNQQQDEYCRGVAELIEQAEREGDAASISGDHQGAAEWHALAEYYLERATRNRYRFTLLRHRVGGIQQPLTIAVSPR